MKKLNIFILLMAVLFASCDDYVNIQPKGQAIAETLEDVNALLDYAMRFSGSYGNSNTMSLLINDNIELMDEDIQGLEASSWQRYQAAMYRLEDRFYLSSDDDRGWDSPYACISNCNYILEITPDIEGDEATKNQYIAEALVHRAHAYFRLVNFYAVHYNLPQAAEEGSGVPIVLTYADQNVSLQRASVTEVYDFIVKDLKEAIPMLMVDRPFIDRVNKSAAESLLARVYLHMGNYTGEESALAYANKALAYNSTLIDYNSLSGAPPKGADNPEYLLFKELSYSSIGSWPNYKGIGRFSPGLIAAFDKPANDLRLTEIPDNPSEGNYIVGLTSYRNFAEIIGVTVPELLLIKAECLARTGDFNGAEEVINTLRSKRFDRKPFIDDTDPDNPVFDEAAFIASYTEDFTTEEEAVDFVVNERRLEFHIFGMRFFDIKRLNAVENAGISFTREWDYEDGNPQKSVTWSANSINWAMPIGEKVIQTSNGQIKQNPREQ